MKKKVHSIGLLPFLLVVVITTVVSFPPSCCCAYHFSAPAFGHNNNHRRRRNLQTPLRAAMSSSQSRNNIKAVLWDMDGTLLDTETLSDRAILDILKPSRENMIPWELKKPTLGLRGADWIPMVLDFARDEWKIPVSEIPTLEEFWERWETLLNEYCEKQVEACEGATELVLQLSNAGVPMAIATSSRAAAVARKRKRHEHTIFNKMECIVTGDDPAVKHGKPSPDIYLEAAKRLGVKPEECLVMEDAFAGVQAGKAAGCAVAVVPDARYTREEKQSKFAKEADADVVLDSWCDFDCEMFGLPSQVLLESQEQLPN